MNSVDKRLSLEYFEDNFEFMYLKDLVRCQLIF